MEGWPLRFVMGENGFVVEVKFRDIKELKEGWSRFLPKWSVFGIELKLGQKVLWITGAERYNCKVVRDLQGRFRFFDVCCAWADVVEVVRVDSRKRVSRFVLGSKIEDDLENWTPGIAKTGGMSITWR